MAVLDVDSTALRDFTARLKALPRSAFPSAVRNTLNNAAFDVKQRTMPAEAKSTFVNRSKNFFRATSTVDMATGFNVESMRSAVGFDDRKAKSGVKPQAIQDLEQQEYGGKIGGRSFVPLDTARTGKSNSKPISARARIANIKNVVNANNVKGNFSKKQKFIRAAFVAATQFGKNGFVLGNSYGGRQTLSRIDSLSSNLRTGKLEIKRTPLYTYVKDRKVGVKSTGFMKRASHETALNMDTYYITNARKQFEKYLKKQ